jgi:hypothetical protein
MMNKTYTGLRGSGEGIGLGTILPTIRSPRIGSSGSFSGSFSGLTELLLLSSLELSSSDTCTVRAILVSVNEFQMKETNREQGLEYAPPASSLSERQQCLQGHLSRQDPSVMSALKHWGLETYGVRPLASRTESLAPFATSSLQMFKCFPSTAS